MRAPSPLCGVLVLTPSSRSVVYKEAISRNRFLFFLRSTIFFSVYKSKCILLVYEKETDDAEDDTDDDSVTQEDGWYR